LAAACPARWTTPYEVSGWVLGSRVEGSREALLRTRQAPARFLQRPDLPDCALCLRLDTTRTSLSGVAASLQVLKTGGRVVGGMMATARTPGFEANDLGFQQSADAASVVAGGEYQQYEPGPLFRSWRLGAGVFSTWSLGGERTLALKRTYRQGWILTAAKYAVLLSAYWMAFTFAVTSVVFLVVLTTQPPRAFLQPGSGEILHPEEALPEGAALVGVEELPVRGHQRAALDRGERHVQAVVDGGTGGLRDVEGALQQGGGRMDLHRDEGEGLQGCAGGLPGHFAAAHLLPEDVAELGEEEVRSQQNGSVAQEAERRPGVDLGDVPLDRDAGVHHGAGHRSRSSRRSSALSLAA
jgi:hypothetical protein